VGYCKVMAYSQSGLRGRLSYRQTWRGHITQSVMVMAYGNKRSKGVERGLDPAGLRAIADVANTGSEANPTGALTHWNPSPCPQLPNLYLLYVKYPISFLVIHSFYVKMTFVFVFYLEGIKGQISSVCRP